MPCICCKASLTLSVAHKAALVQKQFVLNFMTSYMALIFTAFVYIPFGDILLPFLDFWRRTAQFLTFSEKPLPTQQFRIDPERISSQMFYFTVTAQVVNFATEVIVPYVKHNAFTKAKELQTKTMEVQDHAEEAAFLKRVRGECAFEVYDVTDDYREMVMQFGELETMLMCPHSTKKVSNKNFFQVTYPFSRWRGHWPRAVSSSTTGLSCVPMDSKLPLATNDRFLGDRTQSAHGSMPLDSCRGSVVSRALQSCSFAVAPRVGTGAPHPKFRRGAAFSAFSWQNTFTC